MRPGKTLRLLSLLLLIGAGAAPWRVPPAFGAAPGVMSREAVIALAEQRYDARVVRAELSEGGTRPSYVLRLLSRDGRIWTVRVDAVSGQPW